MARRSSWVSATLAAGLVLIWAGERVVDSGLARGVLSGLGAALALGATLWRLARLARLVRTERADARSAETLLLGFHGLVVAALALYALQSDLWAKLSGTALSVGWPTLADALLVAWPVALTAALLPTLLVELALVSMRRAPHLELPRLREAMYSGLGLASVLVFAACAQYVASAFDVRRDLAHFRTTEPGEATRNLIRSLDEPLEAHLFFPPGNEVGERVRAYFEALRSLSPKLTIAEHDHPLEPKLAKELGVSTNGTIVLRRGSRKESSWVGTDLEKSRHVLRTLDSDVQKRLRQVAKSRRTVYLTSGHGERLKNPSVVGDERATVALLQDLLQNLNFDVRPLSAAEGLGQEVPRDAAAVLVLGPTRAFSEPEALALEAYGKRGGRLFLALDPESGLAFDELTRPLGLSFAPTVLCDDKFFARSRRHSTADRSIIFTRSYSSHPAVTTLGKTQTPLLFMGAGSLDERAPRPQGLRIDFAARTGLNTWADSQPGFEFESPPEQRKAWSLLAALTRSAESGKPEDEFRGLVLADSDALADVILSQAEGNGFLVVEGLKWLLGEDQLMGVTNSELDVPLARTQTQDKAWFFGTLFLAPSAVLGIGVLARRRSRRSPRATSAPARGPSEPPVAATKEASS